MSEKTAAWPSRLSGAAVILLLAGCMGDPRTTNQGGGSIITAATKVHDQQLNQLTPDEVQIVADLVSDLLPEVDIELSDDVADAVTALFVENEVTSFDEARTLADALIHTPQVVHIPPALTTLFVADRTANQGGGTVLSAIQKIKGDALDTLTPDEVQIVTDFLANLLGDADRQLTDEEADAIVQFLRIQQIQTTDQAEEFAQSAKDDPDAIGLPPALESLLENLKGLESLRDLDLDHLDLSNLF